MHPRDHLSRRRLATILVMVAALLSTLTSPVSAVTEITRVGDRFEPFRSARRSEAIAFLHRLNTNQLYG